MDSSQVVVVVLVQIFFLRFRFSIAVAKQTW